jgi:hypothetical protein
MEVLFEAILAMRDSSRGGRWVYELVDMRTEMAF